MRLSAKHLLPALLAFAAVAGFFVWYVERLRSGFGLSEIIDSPVPAPGERRWLKGQLHVHSSNSGDSQTPPSEVAAWYAARGYDFIVFTDHNFVTVEPSVGELLVIPGMEITQNLETCDPPPLPGQGCLLHVNALFVDPSRVSRLPEPASSRRVDLYGAAVEAALRMGALPQVNHPNYRYGADGPLLAELSKRGVRLFEVANEAVDSNNAGDAEHLSTEALWDSALGLGAQLFGTATDDAHHYDEPGEEDSEGPVKYRGNRGFVMVKASKDPAAIRGALERGDFYSSNGVVLWRVERADGGLHLEVASGGEHEFRFIGPGGERLASSRGHEADFASPDGGLFRAEVVDSEGRKAWTQPVLPAPRVP